MCICRNWPAKVNIHYSKKFSLSLPLSPLSPLSLVNQDLTEAVLQKRDITTEAFTLSTQTEMYILCQDREVEIIEVVLFRSFSRLCKQLSGIAFCFLS